MKKEYESIEKKIKALRKSGLTYTAIGRRFGLSGRLAKVVLEWRSPIGEDRKSAYKRTTITTSQFAKLVGLHENTIRRWGDEGILRSFRVGTRGDRRFYRDDVTFIIENRSPRGKL